VRVGGWRSQLPRRCAAFRRRIIRPASAVPNRICASRVLLDPENRPTRVTSVNGRIEPSGRG
jgi:hypothetical protein